MADHPMTDIGGFITKIAEEITAEYRGSRSSQVDLNRSICMLAAVYMAEERWKDVGKHYEEIFKFTRDLHGATYEPALAKLLNVARVHRIREEFERAEGLIKIILGLFQKRKHMFEQSYLEVVFELATVYLD